MPIFNKDITFIHIPKTGGTSIENFLKSIGYKMSLFTDINSIYINGHTPQHCTYRELDELNLLTDKVFTVMRPEIERTVSEYKYILNYRPDLSKLFNSFDEFLDLFLDENNYLLFDLHNLPNIEFIKNKNGKIADNIMIFNFFDIKSIENYLGVNGLINFHEFNTTPTKIHLSGTQIDRINNFYNRYK